MDRRFSEKTPIEKGWSGDKKFRVVTAEGETFLFRVSPKEQYERKKAEFSYMQQVAARGVPLCDPVSFGLCEEGVYSLQRWIEGEDLEGIINRFPKDSQTALGLLAGQYLKKIHTIPAPAEAEDWADRFNRKMDRKIAQYRACPVPIAGGAEWIAYIEANRSLLEGRPQCFQHGDYHIGNMMLERGDLVVIDFNRCDFGDPWEEFNRIVWCAQKSNTFATGMVNGYFDGNVPRAFWRLLALYIASNTLSSVPWAVPFGEKEVQTMQAQALEVLGWYGGDPARQAVPSWYEGPSS